MTLLEGGEEEEEGWGGISSDLLLCVLCVCVVVTRKREWPSHLLRDCVSLSIDSKQSLAPDTFRASPSLLQPRSCSAGRVTSR